MKILNLSIDQSIFDKDSAFAKRITDYSGLVDQYTVIVPNKVKKEIKLADNFNIYGINGNFKAIQLLNVYKFVSQLLKKEKYDLITVQDQYYLAALGLLLARKYKIALEIQVHGIEKYGGLRKIIANYVLPKADAIRTVSERLKRRLVELVRVNEAKIMVVPIFTEKKEDVFIRDYQLNNPIVVLTISRLVPIKNVDLQIKALANLRQENLNVELWIVGNGSEEKKLKQTAVELGVKDRVKFYGWQKNLDDFYKQADCFLLTSEFEGWGMVIIEAANYGLPIIMTDVGCAGEVIKNEESGLVVPVGNLEKIVASLRIIINNEALREKLGKNAKTAVQNLPSQEKTLQLYKSSWEKAINNVK